MRHGSRKAVGAKALKLFGRNHRTPSTAGPVSEHPIREPSAAVVVSHDAHRRRATTLRIRAQARSRARFSPLGRVEAQEAGAGEVINYKRGQHVTATA